ncbi:competence type IV pilus minor pilin ComGD [Alteribacillus iranensis]|uniref:Competence protein ComGD n=1 Tax=Alteribacillus iranensis TaxID=930128 RepID=A0A1I1ZEP1_9BACI|nr:competence type IV pilus minor pilin ComGD [Alteribacillus iranensis]SFE30206.1 competence protein ComGD [Alteribacillus iranensis]
MKQIVKAESGHTLSEMVVVLMVITVTLGIPILSYHSIHTKQVYRHFIELVSEDLRFAQQYAYANSKGVLIQVAGDHYYVKPEGIGEDPLITRKIPANLSIERSTVHLSEIFFNTRGNIRKPGTFYMITPAGRYRFVFLVGRGRFYVEET